jgi:predicted nucleic acid-binding protein
MPVRAAKGMGSRVSAIEHRFDEIPPALLYLDTNILIACLIRTHMDHGLCARFLERLVSHGYTTIYLSSLSWLEFTHVVMKEDFRRTLPGEFQARFRLHRWQTPRVRQTYLRFMVSQLTGMLASFDWAEISLTAAIRGAAIEYVASHNLDTHDATHLATARHEGIEHLATLDTTFRRVDGLHLWNNFR